MRIAAQPITGQRALGLQRGQRVLHLGDHVVVDLVEVRVLAVALAQVDRRQHLDRDLRRARGRGRACRRRSGPTGSASEIGSTFSRNILSRRSSLARPSPRLRNSAVSWPPTDTTGTIGTSCSSARRMKPLRPPKSTLRALPAGPVHLVVAAGVDQQRGAGVERLVGVLRRGRHRAVLAQEAQAGHRQHQVVGELVEAPLDAEVGVEGQREHAGVGRQVAAGVVAHQQHRPLGRDALEAAHLGPEPEAGQQPQAAAATRGCSRDRARRGRPWARAPGPGARPRP